MLSIRNALRLCPQGMLISSDLAYDVNSVNFRVMFDIWVQMWRHTEIPEEEIKKMRSSFGRDVAILPPQEVEAIIVEGGFEIPVQIYQSLLIHAWVSRRASPTDIKADRLESQ